MNKSELISLFESKFQSEVKPKLSGSDDILKIVEELPLVGGFVTNFIKENIDKSNLSEIENTEITLFIKDYITSNFRNIFD
tara:strand:+ start:78 stop:320 length:243 start_codon:yes stop_codon:yes gene_type:complete